MGDLIYTKNSNFIEISCINVKRYCGIVYDLSIKNVKNYFANNILCHNTSENILTPLLLKNKTLIISSLNKFNNWNNNNIISIKTKNDLNKLNNIKNKLILISYKCILEYIDNYDLIEFTKNISLID